MDSAEFTEWLARDALIARERREAQAAAQAAADGPEGTPTGR